ncbi:MAG: lytic transglycosylase domain-containing protein [Pseudomonadota bacterium]
MTRILLSLILTFAIASPLLADRPRPLGSAIDAVRKGDWVRAAQVAARDGSVASDIIEWERLRAGKGSYSEIRAFLERRPNWPGEPYLRKRSEAAVISAGDASILSFFDETPPQTAKGILAYARALVANGQSGDAEVALVLAWRTMEIDSNTHALFLSRHVDLLKPHHTARLDAMLWEGEDDDAKRMFDLVPDAWVKLAKARLGLQVRAGNVDTLIAAVPDELADNPGLAHDRMEWRMRKGRPESAKELMLERSVSAESLGRPEEWSNRRRSLARDEMRDSNYKRAYQLASQHHLVDGSAYADLEWLSGYISLRFLNEPQVALKHFSNFDTAVYTPISQGRAGYWKGRALEAMGNAARADMAYAAAAQYQTSFYGLLAAEKAGLALDTSLTGNADISDWRSSDLAKRDLFEAGLLLQASGELSLAERFWTHLAETVPPAEAAQLGRAAIDVDQPHLAVMIGKRLARRTIVEPAPYYPLHPIAEKNLPMAPEMVLAIARRESEFDPVVQSGVGALGLMQIMPATGREVAKRLGRSSQHQTTKLISDPSYNAELGAAYLAMLSERFRGNVILMSAGYNAGPSRPESWQKRFGRLNRLPEDFDVVDWIEHIPFRETRNYVMRVAESLPVYRARLGKDPLPVPFSEELTGSTLLATLSP